MNGPIAVLAGTPVDTRMGVAYLEERGLPGVPFPLSRGPREQTAFQHAPAADKRRQALAVLRGAMAQGCRRAFVYCNSLSAAVDFPGLAEETGMRIVTPLDVYRRLALRYRALGVIAANAQGLSGIEKVLLEANPALDLLGPVRCRWCWPWRRGCRRRSWWNATVWWRWQRGLPTAGWRRWCWAARTSPILRRPWRPGQGCRWWTRRRRCSAC